MKFEGLPQAEFNENESLEPMSREVLDVKNGIQRKIIQKNIPPGADLALYPAQWIKENSGDFHEIFVNEIKKNPEIIKLWENEEKQDEIADRFKRMLKREAA